MLQVAIVQREYRSYEFSGETPRVSQIRQLRKELENREVGSFTVDARGIVLDDLMADLDTIDQAVLDAIKEVFGEVEIYHPEADDPIWGGDRTQFTELWAGRRFSILTTSNNSIALVVEQAYADNDNRLRTPHLQVVIEHASGEHSLTVGQSGQLIVADIDGDFDFKDVAQDIATQGGVGYIAGGYYGLLIQGDAKPAVFRVRSISFA